MAHDFSEAKKKELLNQLRAVENENQNVVLDAVGDLWSTCMSWIGILSIENYVGNVKEYHRKIMDQKDMEEKELKKIFENVSSVDKEYGNTFNNLADTLSEYKHSISQMTALMQLDKANFTSSYIKQAGKSIAVSLNSGLMIYEKVFDKEFSKAEKRIFWQELKESALDLLGFVGGVADFAYDCAQRDAVGATASLWETTDKFVGFLGGLGAIASIGLGAVFHVRTMGVRQAKKNQRVDGIEGWLKEAGCKDAASVAKGIDLAADAYGLFDDAKDIYKSFGKAGSIATNSEYTWQKKAIEYVKMGRGEIGIGDPAVVADSAKSFTEYAIKYDKTIISNVKTVVGYGIAASEGELGKKIFGKTGLGGFASDYREFLEDTGEFLTKDLGLPGMYDLMCLFS